MPIKPPSAYEEISEADEALILKLEEAMDAHFRDGKYGPFSVNLLQGQAYPERIYTEFIRRAKEAGWEAVTYGGVVMISKPPPR